MAGGGTKWPNGAKAALTFTMDNMGEAADLNRNLWPADKPIGNHYSVRQVLPTMLGLLDKYAVKATYFIESWNVDVYPDAIREVKNRGHEVAWHAWQHEAWGKLSGAPEEEKENFGRSFENIKKLEGVGVGRYVGFRPPGGLINQGVTLPLMKEHGLKYLSPAAEDAAVETEEGIVVLPFRWRNIDAYYYMDSFSGLRVMKGEQKESMTAEELTKRYIQSIDEVVAQGGYISLLFHPFLQTEPSRLEAVENVLKHLKEKREDIWIAPCQEVAEWILEHPGIVGGDPGWDRSSWR